MRILVVGVSHKTADVALRERLAIDPKDLGRALAALRDRHRQAEFVLLSTCNRTELYCARPVHGHPREAELLEQLGQPRALAANLYVAGAYTFTDAAAVRHLFAVVSGLDSMVLGESQILAQVKHAYARAVEAQAVGPVLNALFQAALATAKVVHSGTDIAAGPTSVAGAAVDLARQVLGAPAEASVLSVGAGKMNVLMLRRLRELGCRRFCVLNRSLQRARRTVEALTEAGLEAPRAGNLEELPQRLAEADLAVCSTGSPEPVLRAEVVEQAMLRRPQRPLVVVDIAVPRDVEDAARTVPNVRLFNIDDLDAVVRASLRTRIGELEKCDAILERQVRQFLDWLAQREVAPIIQSLRRRLRGIADEELLAAERKFSTHADAAEDHAILQRAMHRLVQRILHTPTHNLRRHSGSEAARMHAAVLRRLFDLDGE